MIDRKIDTDYTDRLADIQISALSPNPCIHLSEYEGKHLP